MNQVVSSEDIKALLSCSTYRDFISLIMTIKSRRGRPFTYAEISRKLGFKSRSYIRDVVIGTKNLSLLLAPKLSKELGLNHDLKTYFELLVERDFLERKNNSNKLPSVRQKLRKLKSRLQQSTDKEDFTDEAFSIPEIPIVYAALGEKDSGVTIKEILLKTKLEKEVILKALSVLLKLKLTKTEGNYFFPLDEHISFEFLKSSEAFKNHYLYTCEKSMTLARIHFHSQEKLFFSSSFSVPKDKLPSLKDELRRVLLQYVDDNEAAKGDRVASVVCSLF